jgi:hypothetical protein
MYDDTEYTEIEELIRKIKDYAFRKESFLFVEKQNQKVKGEEFKVYTKFYSLNSLNKRYPIMFKWRKEIKGLYVNENNQIICHELEDKSRVLNHFQRIEEFISDLAENIFSYKHFMVPEFEKKLIKNIKKNIMNRVKKFLSKAQYFSKEAMDNAIRLLAEDLDKKFKEPKKYYAEIHKGSRSAERIIEENYVIELIYSLYKNYLFKEDKRRGRRRSIISNIAFVFAATDFWDDNIEDPNRVRKYSDRIKKRLKFQ